MDADSWFMFYLFEWAAVVTLAAFAPFVGFTVFFALTAASGVMTAGSLLLKFPEFFSEAGALAFESGPVAKLGQTPVTVSLYVDTLGYAFGLLTALIGSAVYFYAFSYMRFEKNILNFLIYLQVFKLSMMLLVWANSWFTLILGWELIGASSFLLINF